MRTGILVSLFRDFLFLVLLGVAVCPRAFAGVGVVLNESLDTSAEWITGSGHTAVYFSRICPASPVKLRLCRPGENGSIMSNYINLGENQRFEWNIAPLDEYLYGVQNPENRPLFGSPRLKALLERRYRVKFLSKYCSAKSCVMSDKAEWREMVAATMSRSMYIFYVDTSVQQDLRLIAEFNALPNKNHFDGMTNNCADFVKGILDTYFPHSAHRDVVDDFGMTSPKAVARSFTDYALRHRELQFCVLHFSQLPGTIKRSSEPRNGTEQLFRSKKLLIPMAIFATHELPVVTAAYIVHGRFNPEAEFEEHPAAGTMLTVELGGYQTVSAKAASNADGARSGHAQEERQAIVGTTAEWKHYRMQFNAMVKDAVRERIIPSKASVGRLFRDLDRFGEPYVAPNGSLWLRVNGVGELGVSADSIFAPGSDRRMAFVFLLARVQQELKSSKHCRESMYELRDDWGRLEHARTRIPRANIFASNTGSQEAGTRF